MHKKAITPKVHSENNISQRLCQTKQQETKKQSEWRGCPLSILLETHLVVQVLGGFPLLLQPCCCLLGLEILKDPVLLLYLLPEQGESAYLYLHLVQLQSAEWGCRMRWCTEKNYIKDPGWWCTLSTSTVIYCSRCKRINLYLSLKHITDLILLSSSI